MDLPLDGYSHEGVTILLLQCQSLTPRSPVGFSEILGGGGRV